MAGVTMFASADELAIQLQQSVDAEVAEQLLTQATQIVRDWTGQTISRVTGDVFQDYSDGSDIFMLPQIPVTAVSAVSVGGVSLGSAEWAFSTRGALYRVLLTGSTVALWKGYWERNIPVRVTYDHGYTAIPAAVKSIVLELAGQLYTNPVGSIQSESVAGYSVTYAVSTAISAGRMGLTSDMQERLKSYRLRDL